MRKLLLFPIMFLMATMAFADDNSATALIIRKGADKTLTLMSITNPNPPLAANQGAPAVTFQNTRQLQLQTDVQSYTAQLLTTGINTNGSTTPLGANLVIIWYDNTTASYVVTVIPDTGQTGSYLAFTSSLSAVLNSVIDHLYTGL